MRILIAALAGLGLLGCAAPTPPPSSPVTQERQPLLDQSVQGKVVMVNSVLRYVVLDFPIRRVPSLDQHLNLYRDGQKVGEVSVSGPFRNTTVAADIIAGQAEIGDVVRDD